MTTGYNAGLDSSDAVFTYAVEAAWAVTPAVAFKKLRLLSEGFTQEKTRTRPLEIQPAGYAIHAITTQQAAKGSLAFGLSFGTFDDLLAGALNGQWTTGLNIASGTTSITVPVGGPPGVITITGTGFTGGATDIKVGQVIKTLGFTNAVNNNAFRVVTVNATTITAYSITGATTIAESGAAVTIYGSMLQNSNHVATFQFQKQFSSALFLLFPGAYPTSWGLSMAVGKYAEGTMNFLAKTGVPGTSDAGTGGDVAAPTGRIIDNITGFSGFAVNDVVPTAVLQAIDLNSQKLRSASQYGIGSATAVGMRRGTYELSGKLALFFKDLVYYNDFINETDIRLSWMLSDHAGNAYVMTICAATIMNPTVVAKGIDQDIIAEFTLEGNPADSTDVLYPNLTMQIDRLPVTNSYYGFGT